jgi:hypothetical protein
MESPSGEGREESSISYAGKLLLSLDYGSSTATTVWTRRWMGVRGERKVGPGLAERHLLNPRELANHHSQLAHFGGDNGWRSCHGYTRLMLFQCSKINIFRFISYTLSVRLLDLDVQ